MQQEQNQCREVAIDDHVNNYANVTSKVLNTEQTRMDRIQQLRAEHQRRHIERSGKYIPDEREEDHYESDHRQVFISIFHSYWCFEQYFFSLLLA